MTWRVAVADPLEEPIPGEWQAFVRTHGLSAAWDPDLLRALAWCGEHRQIMAVVCDAGGHPAALFAARRRTPRLRRGYATGGPLTDRPRTDRPRTGRRGLPDGLPGLLECRLPPAVTSAGYAFHPALDDPGRAAVVRAFERTALGRYGPGTAGVVYRQVRHEDLAAFQGRGRTVRRVLPEAVLDNRWDSFEAYMSGLPRRDRRNLRRVYRLVDDDPLVRTGIEPRLEGPEAVRLLHSVQLRHHSGGPRWVRGGGGPPAPFPAVYHDLLGGRAGVRYFTYREPEPDAGLLAYGLLVDDGTTLRCQGWGSRDAVAGSRGSLYFDHFLRQIAYLIERGRDRLILGKTMTELKERYGACSVPLYAVVSVRGAR